MEKSIYRYILKHTKREQLFLILLTCISMPLIYISLEIPKSIINNALGPEGIPEQFLGVNIELDHLRYLLLLCFGYFLITIANGSLKYVMNVYRGALGERMLRRFRYTLYNRILRFPLTRFKHVSSSEMIPMITAETEALGGFIGDSIALPVFQGGLFLTYLFFIFNQGFWLGIVAIALIPPQILIIPKLQRKVNALSKKRVKIVRKLADHVGESISGISDIHSHHTRRYEQAFASDRLGKIFSIRFEIYKRKFFIKFLNNFLSVLTPIFFYSFGGYMVLQGELTIGALVAVLAAYKDLSSPWKELLKFYQITQNVKVKYQQIIEQFDPPNMFKPKLLEGLVDEKTTFSNSLVAFNLSYKDEDDKRIINRANATLALDQHIAIRAHGGTDTDTLAQLLARLISPTAGQILIDELDSAHFTEATIGKRTAYSGPDSHIFNSSLTDNLLYGLKHQREPQWDRAEVKAINRDRHVKEAVATNNSVDDAHGNWIDFRATGAKDREDFDQIIDSVLKTLELDHEAFDLGLMEITRIDRHPDLPEKILQIRKDIADELKKPENAALVEFFDAEQYNSNLSVAENILFGAPLSEDYDIDCLSCNARINLLLKKHNLDKTFLEIGHQLTEIMLELFAEVSADDELFEQFSFIHADDFPDYQRIQTNVEKSGLDRINREDREMLVALTYKLTPARHRLGLIDEMIQPKILRVRAALRKELGENNDDIAFFDLNEYNPVVSIQENIVFGRVAYGLATAQQSIRTLIEKAVKRAGCRAGIAWSGLDYIAGTGGKRLSLVQRQKIMVGRCLIKNPDILIINDTLSALDPESLARILDNIIEFRRGKNLIWVLNNPDLKNRFDSIISIEAGKLNQAPIEITDAVPA